MSDTLVLNADGLPVSVVPLSAVSWKEAILYMYHDKCDVLEWYDDWVVHSASWETRVPAVIMLKDYLKRQTSVRFSRQNVYLRDEYRCLYCNNHLSNKTATMDHVLPLSLGGKTNWTNIVTACGPCNHKKSNKTKIKPRYAPYKPSYFELVEKRKKLPFYAIKHNSWNNWLQIE